MVPHRRICFSLFVAALCAADVSAADVFRTVAPDGSVTYSDEVTGTAPTLRLYDSAGIVPAAPVKPDPDGFARRRDVRLRRSALEERLRQARGELEAARLALSSGVDQVEVAVGPDQLASVPGGSGVVAVFATPGGGESAQRIALNPQGGTAAARSVVSANGGLDSAGSGLNPLGGSGAPGAGPGPNGGLVTTGTSLTPLGGAGNRTAAARPRAYSRYVEKVEFLATVVAQREAEIGSLTAALAALR